MYNLSISFFIYFAKYLKDSSFLNYRFNFHENQINLADLSNKIEKICEILHKSSWFKNSLAGLTYCIEKVKCSSIHSPLSVNIVSGYLK